eukprot:XP_795584.2 PREDICTED: probable thiopurine S-methyltransferase [Strongylocentrotus purpuratus]
MVYRAIIRSLFDYGCEAYDSAAATTKKAIDSVQYQALRICAGMVIFCPRLWERGHEIVGVEAVEDAVLAFFQEQSIKYTVTDVPGMPGAKLYQNEDGRIKIYRCNLFELNRTILGDFDAIYDRGSLVAIGPCDRIKYSELMSSLLGKGGRILLESYLYDKEQFKWKNHSPFSLTEAEVKALYEPKAKVQLLHTRDVLYDVFREAGLEWMSAIMLLLKFD